MKKFGRMGWKEIDYNRDKQAIHDICFDCGSKCMKDTFGYLNLMYFRFPDNVVAEILDNKAFYVARKAKNHWRLIGIAVKKQHQGEKLGKTALFRLLYRLRKAGLDTLTLRTSMQEEAKFFWLKIGARIIDVNGGDYEMEIKLKK